MTKMAATAQRDDAWDEIEEGVCCILRNQGLFRPKFLRLYTIIYERCTMPVEGSRTEVAYYHLLAGCVRQHLCGLCLTARSMPEDKLLLFYKSEWQGFQVSRQCCKSLFNYIERHYIRRGSQTSECKIKELYPIEELFMLLWKEEVFDKLRPTLLRAVLCLEEHQTGLPFRIQLITVHNQCEAVELTQAFPDDATPSSDLEFNQILQMTKEFKVGATLFLCGHELFAELPPEMKAHICRFLPPGMRPSGQRVGPQSRD
eukprot:Colp12_sorted_trinity150504_noHs@6001